MTIARALELLSYPLPSDREEVEEIVRKAVEELREPLLIRKVERTPIIIEDDE